MNATTVDALLVIACDMPDLQTHMITRLLEAYTKKRYDFYAYHDQDLYQPFPAIYTRIGVKKHPAARSLQQLLQKGNSYAIDKAGDDSFPNYNQLP